jgi:hypothetical protein
VVKATEKSWGSCNIFVANNPQAFLESYWEVNYLEVYEVVAGVSAPPAQVPSDTTSTAGAVWSTSWTTPAPYGPVASHKYE